MNEQALGHVSQEGRAGCTYGADDIGVGTRWIGPSASSSGRQEDGPRRYLSDELVEEVRRCHRDNADVGSCTRGTGSASSLTVAGTPHRQDELIYVMRTHRQRTGTDHDVPAVVMAEPTNAHDKNAIAVFVDGVHLGYLFREDAAQWQKVVQECLRREQVLVGNLHFYESRDGLLGARIALRDCLPGFVGPITKAAKASKLEHLEPQRLTGDDLTTVIRALEHLTGQETVRTKQKAGLVVKNLRKVLPQLRAHGEALDADGADEDRTFADKLNEAEGAAEDLIDEAEDADEREDYHNQLKWSLEELTAELAKA